MDPGWGKVIGILGALTMIAIRAPHGHRSRSVPVARSRKGPLETFLLTLAWLSFFAPLVWACSPAMAFADYPLRPARYLAGVASMAVGLWLFHRSHVDLGTNWSITLEVREGHTLVTEGVYRRVRHPMYSALILFSAGQALAVPNWIAGPSYLVVFGLLFALRIGPEERMMREEFGAEYEAYAARTKRIIPCVW
jgi:protein-S-isoprenylcysteine O-methyltransferase Ste14